MQSNFPVIGVIGATTLQDFFEQPAKSLGIGFLKLEPNDTVAISHCSVISPFGEGINNSQMKSLEKSGNALRPSPFVIERTQSWNSGQKSDQEIQYSVLVARSPHGQASAWAVTELIESRVLVTPAPSLTSRLLASAQEIALGIAKEISLVGVMEVEVLLVAGEVSPGRLTLGPTLRGVWSIEGARTSQFEQHIRAILDLPLGDPSARQRFAVTGAYAGSGNMYRPYLHLMARSPAIKFHQYGQPANSGHVTALGRDLLDLQEGVLHAIEYMSGEIDE